MADHAKNPTLVDNLGDNTVLNALKQLLSFAQSLNVATGTFEIGSLPALDGEEVSLVAYKANFDELARLNEQGYEVFVRDIQKVGYEKRTKKRNVFFNDIYKIDESTFEIQLDTEGRAILDEEFTQTIADFRQWALGQEERLQTLFLSES